MLLTTVAGADDKICLEQSALVRKWTAPEGKIDFIGQGRSEVLGTWNAGKGKLDLREGHISASFANCALTEGKFTGKNAKGDPITGTIAMRMVKTSEGYALDVVFNETYPEKKQILWTVWF